MREFITSHGKEKVFPQTLEGSSNATKKDTYAVGSMMVFFEVSVKSFHFTFIRKASDHQGRYTKHNIAYTYLFTVFLDS